MKLSPSIQSICCLLFQPKLHSNFNFNFNFSHSNFKFIPASSPLHSTLLCISFPFPFLFSSLLPLNNQFLSSHLMQILHLLTILVSSSSINHRMKIHSLLHHSLTANVLHLHPITLIYPKSFTSRTLI